MTMQPSIFRRNYYLMRAHSRDQLKKDQNRERQIYTQTARVVNQMITLVKTLLIKINSFKQELQLLTQQKDSSSEEQDCEDVFQRFKQVQKEIPLTFFAQYPLDNNMLGAFVMRISKQINYWAKPLPYLFQIVEDIDKLFQEQKNSQNQNIALIYFITIKKLISKTNQFFKRIKSIEPKPKQSPREQPTNIIIESQNHQIQKIAYQIKATFNIIYRDLDLDLDLEQSIYAQPSQKEANLSLFCRRQLRRNKKIKKQIRSYKIAYQQNKGKKEKQQLRRKRGRTFSNTDIKMKLCIIKSNSKTKTKDSGGQKHIVLLPSINNSQEKGLKLSKKSRQRQFSFEKGKKKSALQTNKAQLRLKL